MQKKLPNFIFIILFMVVGISAHEFIVDNSKPVPAVKIRSKKSINTIREELVTASVDALEQVLAKIQCIASAPTSAAQKTSIVELAQLGQELLSLSRSIIENDKQKTVNRVSKKELLELKTIVEEINKNTRKVPQCLSIVPTWVNTAVKSLQKYMLVVN